MKGTSRGDFSRQLFDRSKHYRSVRMQQGRVQLDSDWNAQVDLMTYRQRTETVDMLGASGAPAGEAGYALVGGALEMGLHHIAIGLDEAWVLPQTDGMTFETRLTLHRDSNGIPEEGRILSLWQTDLEDRYMEVFYLRIQQGALRFQRRGIAEPDLLTGPLPSQETYIDLALSYRDDETTLYVNGLEVLTDPNGLNLASRRTLMLLGAGYREGQPADLLPAEIFDARLWSDARQPRDIGRDPQGDEENLLGWWRFEEGAGTVVLDSSRHCNHGVIRGPANQRARWLPPRFLSAGRFYVDGILCENETTVDFAAQADLPGAEFPSGGADLPPSHLFYLDVWERSISSVEDPELREVALEGPDTTLRNRIVAQVRTLPIPPTVDDQAVEDLTPWKALVSPPGGRLRARHNPSPKTLLENRLYRVEIHHGGFLDAETIAFRRHPDDPAALQLDLWDGFWQVGQNIELQDAKGKVLARRRVAAVDPQTHKLILQDSAPPIDPQKDAPPIDPQKDGSSLPTESGYLRRTISVKWSRDNTSTVFPIRPLQEDQTTVQIIPDAFPGRRLAVGQWVEVVDDRSILRDEASQLLQVKSVDRDGTSIELSPPPPPGRARYAQDHPHLRLWDQSGDAVSVHKEWMAIELGIEVHFEAGEDYRRGDYWWIPTRPLLERGIAWPIDGDDQPLAVPPQGVEHHYAPLAQLTYEDDGYRLDDLRQIFQPRALGAVSKAGDVVEGTLDLRSDLNVEGDLTVAGKAFLGDIHGNLCGTNIVDTEQLVDGSVRQIKLHPEVGTVPPGSLILGPTAEAPPGYVYSGSQTTLWQDQEVPWIDRLEIPNGGPPGPMVSVSSHGQIYTFLESGEVWAYDPGSNSWQRRQDMPVARRAFAVAALEDRIHLLGGLDASNRSTGSHQVYDPDLDSWEPRRDLPTPRGFLAASTHQGHLHAIGGVRHDILGSVITDRHTSYDPTTDAWTRRCPLPRPTSRLGAATLGCKIIVAGGEVRPFLRFLGSRPSAQCLSYDVSNDRWDALPGSLPTPRLSPRLLEVWGRLYSVGGRSTLGWLSTCEYYEPTMGCWLATTPLHEAIRAPAVSAVDGALYVQGAMRSADSGGVLVEELQVAERFFLHRRVLPDDENPSA